MAPPDSINYEEQTTRDIVIALRTEMRHLSKSFDALNEKMGECLVDLEHRIRICESNDATQTGEQKQAAKTAGLVALIVSAIISSVGLLIALLKGGS